MEHVYDGIILAGVRIARGEVDLELEGAAEQGRIEGILLDRAHGWDGRVVVVRGSDRWRLASEGGKRDRSCQGVKKLLHYIAS
jgi:hypothetical protein